MQMTYQYGEKTYTVSLEPLADGRYRATIADQTIIVQARPGQNGETVLQWGDARGELSQRVRVHTAADGDARYAHVNGVSYALNVPDPRAKRRGAATAGGDLTAQMPGQVVEVLVDAGDTVTAGQALVILEAMKMEIRVTAPGDGTVAAVLVAAGDVVDRGQTLVELQQGEA